MTTIAVTFADGETAVVALDFKSPAVIDLVLQAWAVLWQREILEWKPTSAAAEFWYDTKAKRMNRYGERHCHSQLVHVLPIAALRKKLAKQSARTRQS
jgi:hypothetical protein